MLVTAAIELWTGSHTLDRAVLIEGQDRGVGALAGPFTRSQQHGGMLLADLLYGCGVATILAGVLVLVPGTRRAGARWLTATFAGAWGAVVVPAIAYPPLPPGVKSGLDIAVRQWLFLGCFALGAAGALAASVAWHRAGRRSRFLGAAAALAMPLAITIAVLPDQRVGRVPDKELLTHFRIVAVCAQLVFWIVLALAGTLLLRRADTDPAATAAE